MEILLLELDLLLPFHPYITRICASGQRQVISLHVDEAGLDARGFVHNVHESVNALYALAVAVAAPSASRRFTRRNALL